MAGTAALALLLAATAAPVLAQGSEGFFTDFEDSNGWSFQQIEDQVRWNIDSSPSVFVSPTQTLNNIDNLSTATFFGTADAYAPTAFFNGPGNRFIKHWCRFQFIETSGFGTRRWLRLGPQLLTGETILTLYYDDGLPAEGGHANGPVGTCGGGFTDAPANGDPLTGVFIIKCPASDWHEHVFFVGLNSGIIQHNGNPIASSTVQADLLDEKTILQIGFFFSWEGDQNCGTQFFGGGGFGNQGGTISTNGTIAWLIDDLFLSSSLFDPFGPDPQPDPLAGGGGSGGGGGFDCISAVVPVGVGSGGSSGLMPALLGLAALAVAAGRLRRRLAAARLEDLVDGVERKLLALRQSP